MATTKKTSARKTTASKKAASKSTGTRTVARKASTNRSAASRSTRSQSRDTVNNLVDTGRQALEAGLSVAQDYANQGGRVLKKASRTAQDYGRVAVREAKRNPKVTAAIAAGIVTVGSAMIARKIQKGGTGKASLLAHATTAALAQKATQLTHQVSQALRDRV